MADNITTKTLKKTTDMLKLVDKLNKKGMHIPTLLWGDKGVGKSSLVGNMAKELGYDLSVINLANLNPEDMLGTYNFKDGTYNKPSFLVESEKPVVYFIDEINRGAKYMLQCVFNLLTEKRLHQWFLKPEDIVVCAANPDNGEYEVTSFEDGAFISRFAHIKMQPEKEEFTGFLTSKYENTIVQETLKKSVNIYQDEPFELGFNVVPDNRKLEKVAFMFEHCDKSDLEGAGVDLLESLVGFESSAAFLETWRDSQKSVYDPKKILNSTPDKYGFNDDAIEVMNNVNVKMVGYMKGKKTLTKKEQEGFRRYFEFLPKDVRVDFSRQLITVHENFVDYVDADEVFTLLNLGDKV